MSNIKFALEDDAQVAADPLDPELALNSGRSSLAAPNLVISSRGPDMQVVYYL